MAKSSSGSAAPTTVTDRARRAMAWLVDPATRALARMGVPPDAVTLAGLAVNAVIGLIVVAGHLVVAGVALLLSGLFDGLDGALARRIGVTGKFGAFLDSTVDRYSEAFVLFGLLIYAGDRGLLFEQRLVYVTLVGSLLVSYARSRAESLGVDCKVGLLTRMERFLILSATLILQQLTVGLLVLAVLTHVTVAQRVVHVWRALRQSEHDAAP